MRAAQLGLERIVPHRPHPASSRRPCLDEARGAGNVRENEAAQADRSACALAWFGRDQSCWKMSTSLVSRTKSIPMTKVAAAMTIGYQSPE